MAATPVSCTSCGALIAEGAAFCPACGARQEPPVTCQSCGALVKLGARFCPSCGASTAPEALPHPPVPAACSSCGSELAPDARFCAACGAKASLGGSARRSSSGGARRAGGGGLRLLRQRPQARSALLREVRHAAIAVGRRVPCSSDTTTGGRTTSSRSFWFARRPPPFCAPRSTPSDPCERDRRQGTNLARPRTWRRPRCRVS
ncbi:MAG: zinc ribbon domain-containing protein [Dehalococcoidia bacterium]|nr:zinc ribbon domain-containing protein [Dehalococcoidia bacterium]